MGFEDVVSQYKEKAKSQSGKAQEACTTLATAALHLVAGEVEEALEKGKRAVEAAKSGFKAAAPDALSVVVSALIGQEKKSEAYELAKAELASFRSASDKTGEAKMLLAMAQACEAKDLAMTSATEARSLAKSLKDGKMEVAALLVASSLQLGKDSKEALASATKAKEVSLNAGDKRCEADSLHGIAAAQAETGAIEDALASADEALDLYLELKDKRMEAFELLAMAKWHLKDGKASKALSDAEDALEIYEALRSPKELDAMAVLFDCYIGKGDGRKAKKVAQDGLDRAQESGNKSTEAASLKMLLDLYCRLDGGYSDAVKTADLAKDVCQSIGDKKTESQVMSLLCSAHVREQAFDEAIKEGEDALAAIKETGTTSEKVDLMFALAAAHGGKNDYKEALQVANEMKSYFSSEEDKKGEAQALICICNNNFLMEQWDPAANAAQKAQVLLSEEGDVFGEASALALQAESQWKKKDHKTAIKSGERARALFRELGDKKAEEASVLYTIAMNCVLQAVVEGASVGEAGRMSRAAKDAVDKGKKLAEACIRTSREILSQGAEALLGCGLCTLAQVHMLNGQVEEALKASDEAIVIFRDIGDDRSEANALLMSAEALRMLRSNKESGEAAGEALRLYKLCEDGDEEGEKMANEIIAFLQEIQMRQQQEWMAQQQMQGNFQMPQGGGGLNLMPIQQQMMGGPPEQGMSMARVERERGAALDLSAGVDEAMIKGKVLEIALRITGAEDGEIEADTPLMEAGLTSNSAILLRDELTQELPGINLPVTLVFDYPSIASMAELIVEASAKSLK